VGGYYRQARLDRPDGAKIHFEVHGEGEPAMVLTDGLGCDGFAWKYLTPKLREKHRTLRWHFRGHGLSTVALEERRIGMGLNCDDLAAVLDAAGIRRAVLFGHSMGVQVSLEFHRRFPERVAGLVLVCGSYGNPLDTFHNTTLLKRALPFIVKAVERFPDLFRKGNRFLLSNPLAADIAIFIELNRQLMKRQDMQPYFDHMAQMDPVVFFRTLQALSEHSALDHLPKIDVPTLVVGGEQDKFTPAWLSKKMADTIPGAKLLMVPGGSHTAPLESPDDVWAAVSEFLAIVHERERAREDASTPPAKNVAKRRTPVKKKPARRVRPAES
jgi:pimeloyl-ACP methyl ester carboxylesterase